MSEVPVHVQSPWQFFVSGCRRQWPIIVTSTGFGVAGLLVMFSQVRVACLVTVLTLVVAAFLRGVLSEERLGVLVVRSRATDVLLLLVWAVALGSVALPEPNLWAR